jgi:hypothetical protein
MKTPRAKDSAGLCEMCGHYVSVRQKAHIYAEGTKHGNNLLMLCLTCHIMFDTRIKPKLYKALKEAKVTGLPKSWEMSIYDQAAEASSIAKGIRGTRSQKRRT